MKRVLHIIAGILVFLSALSCEKKEVPFSGTYKDVFIYYGAGFNNLSSSLLTNLSELSSGEIPSISEDRAVVAFIHSTAKSGNYSTENSPQLIQLYKEKGQIITDTIKTYPSSSISASKGMLRQVLSDIKTLYKSNSYGFLISSHGTGWLPSQLVYYNPGINLSSAEDRTLPSGAGRREWHPDPDLPATKTIGVQYYQSSSNTYEIELKDLADAFPMKMKYIILDACLSGGVEVAYELKDICDYLIFSPAETLTSGLVVYTSLISRLFDSSGPDLEGVCQDFFDYTEAHTGSYRSGTITLVKSSEIDALASWCKNFYSTHREDIDAIDRSEVQHYFYDSKAWYYDLRDMIRCCNATSSELKELDALLSSCIQYHAETETFFSLKLERCCGLSTYIPYKTQTKANNTYRDLSWNEATGLLQ